MTTIKKEYLNYKNKFRKGLLQNNMKYIISSNKFHNSCSIMIFVRVGSKHEPVEINGAAHFLEHMLFKGTETYKTNLEINKRLDKICASVNAGTTKNMTNYYIKLPSKYIKEGIDILNEMVFKSLIDKNEMEKEKKVVIEEINKVFDDSGDYLDDLLTFHMFKGHTLSPFVLGTKEKILKMTRNNLFKFYQKYYIPSNCCIAVSGDVPKNIISILNDIFVYKEPKLKLPNIIHNYQKINFSKKKEFFFTKMRKQNQISVGFGFPIFDYYDDKRYILDVLTEIMYGNMTSRLWLALRELNPIVYGLSVDDELYEEGGMLSITLSYDKKNTDLAFKVLHRELERLKKELIPKEELDIIKDKLLIELDMEDDDNLEIADFYGEQYILDYKIKTFKDLKNIYRKVTPHILKKMANEIFDYNKVTLIQVGNFNKSKFENTFKKYFL